MLSLKKVLLATVAGLALTAASTSGASAGIVNFTWDPSAVGLDGSSFTANDATGSNFSDIHINNTTGAFTESGFIELGKFFINPGSNAVNTPGNGTTTDPGHPTGYNLYITYTAAGVVTPLGGGNFAGTYTSLNYDLKGDKEAKPTFTFAAENWTATFVNPIELANGVLIPGGNNSAAVLANDAIANIQASFTEDNTNQAFFVAPIKSVTLNVFGALSNTNADPCNFDSSGNLLSQICISNSTTEANTTNVEISGGGASLDLTSPTPVPEPGTVGLFGGFLVAGAFVRRQLRKKA